MKLQRSTWNNCYRGLLSYHDTQSKLTSLSTFKTRQECLFLCDIFYEKVCKRISYVHYCCWPTPQMHLFKYLDKHIWVKLNWLFLLEYAPTVCCHAWMIVGFITRFTQVTSEYEYTQIYLSKDRSLAKTFELWEGFRRFHLENKTIIIAEHFISTEWVAKVTNLCDIFSLLNKFTLFLQGRTKTVFILADKVAAFKSMLKMCGRRVKIWVFAMFQTLGRILEATEPGPSFSQLLHSRLSQ